MRLSVLIASYRRPKLLGNCLRSLEGQTRRPDQVIVAGVEDDLETRDIVQTFAASSPFPCLWCSADRAGVIHQTNAGLERCDGNVVVFTNDDAEAYPDWLERLEPYYDDATVGGVGGRDIVYRADGQVLDGQAACVGKITWFGRVHGNHHLRHPHAVDVDVLKGVNMSCRRDLLRPLDARMAPLGPVHHWEMDPCLEIRRRGWRLVYDPDICVNHYHGAWSSVLDPEFVYMANHNLVLNLGKYFRFPRRWFFMAYTCLWGDYPEMGLAVFGRTYLERLVRDKDWRFIRFLAVSLRGKWDALSALGRG